MDLTEHTVKSRTLFEGHIVKLTLDRARLPDGTLADREVVYHPGGVAILALDEGENVALVRQYRYPMRQLLLELPAGKLEPGEQPDPAALRELREETGLTAKTMDYLGVIYPSVGMLTERIHLYLARGLTQGEMDLDEDEYLRVERIPLKQLEDMALRGEIRDGKTLIALFLIKDKI